MQKVDRLGWAAGVAFSAWGVRVGVRVNRVELLPRIEELLPPGAERCSPRFVDGLFSLYAGAVTPRPGVRSYHLAYAGAGRLARTLDLAEAVAALDGDLRLFVAARAKNRIFVHAGAVGWKGRAILLPGRTHAGKSTLVEALVRAGATYYSDEYAVLDARGRVHPYARPLSLREPGLAIARRCPVEEIGGVAGTEPLPVGLVVQTRYRAGARLRLRRLTPGQAMLALFDNTVPARDAAERALVALRGVALSAAALKGTRGEAGAAAEALLRRAEELPDADRA